MDQDGSAVAISEAVEKALPGLRTDLGSGAELTVVSDQGPRSPRRSPVSPPRAPSD